MNHYEVLGVESGASTEAIKRRYQQLLLQIHPDKKQTSEESAPGATSDRFVAVTEAWKVLKDEQSRRLHDAQLAQRNTHNFCAQVDAEELRRANRWSVACRCGAEYQVDPEGEGQVEYECDDCSLRIQVQHPKP
ncbi:dnaJ homolog subfamily C member 24-like [Neocloeon triangulifer]|uniref:dnaJ homolog subfamily C member 24-like n=1 Tax=Neocloeon triangulifer TaxID=2078957 RepID=UPI00286F1D3A|nr:dnaJ homolog subfamily C member 24-like [Neocloeon triangulifer]XP_059470799.1 dnaJ homolog subfamily C member 24-like [Neocloeon triangulifer]